MLEFLRLAVIYVVPFLIILTVVVTVHELGHFWAGKAFGVAIDRFSIGFGRPLLKHTDKSGVEWRLGWIPLGGYVRFGGDSNDASLPDGEDLVEMRRQIVERYGEEAVQRYHPFKPLWQRAVIAAAGPIANFVLAVAILTVMFSTLEVNRTPPVIGAVAAGSPAAEAGFEAGDVVKRANGEVIRDFRDFAMFVAVRAGREIAFDIERDGAPMRVVVTPTRHVEEDELTRTLVRTGRIGVESDPAAAYSERLSPPAAFVEATRMVKQTIGTTLTYIGGIFIGRENGSEIGGVIGMANASGSITRAVMDEAPDTSSFFTTTALMLLQLTAMLSIGIGFVNLLPIPVLDGGHLAFYAYEAVARKPLNARIQMASFRVGLALVLCLMLFATWNDLQRLQAFKFLGGLFS